MSNYWPWYAWSSWRSAASFAVWTYREQNVRGAGWMALPFDIIGEVVRLHGVSRDFARQDQGR